MTTILSVDNLRKNFGGVTAVDGVSFDVEAGTITGLIGPNGAGKTTTFGLISGFLEPDGGEVRFDGTDTQSLMRPSRKERTVWASSAGIVAGAGGLSAAGLTGLSTAGLAVGTVLGGALGLGGYLGQNRLKDRYLSTRRTRPARLSQAGLARTFQITREFQEMTVLENMLLASKGQRGESVFSVWFRRDAIADQESALRSEAVDTLEFLELDHLMDEKAGNLSGGQRKLLELGRILMTDPDMLLLDEPVAGVNPSLTQKLLDRIDDLQAEGYTFLVIEHDMDVIMDISDTIIVMSEGDKLMKGSPEEVRSDERVIDAYLGQ